jgi:hypothetical protein
MNYVDFRRPVALIGAGQLGKMAIELWPPELEKPVFFLDENVSQEIHGIPILKTSSHKPDSSIQYVLSYFKSDPKTIKHLFETFLNQEIITVYDLLTQANPDLFSNGWKGDSENLENARSNLPFFADEQSRVIYSEVLDWRYLRNLGNAVPSPETDKYNLKKYGRASSQYDLVIDGGSYDFSFPKSLLDSNITWKNLIAIEPDPSRQAEVLNQMDQTSMLTDFPGDCRLEKRALWSTNQGAYFYSNGLLSARIAKSPDETCTKIKTVTLEALLTPQIEGANTKLLTKLHVEGAEWPVIYSSSRFLERDITNDIIINLSHDEESLVKIPELLHNLGKHDLFLHSHALFGEGLTLIARSKGRL